MRTFLKTTFIACSLIGVVLRAAPEKPLAALADEQFAFAAQQYRVLLANAAGQKGQPRTTEHGKVKMVPVSDWVSGFFPGSLWMIYEHTGDDAFKAAAQEYTARQEPIKNVTKHHDVGFMLYCSYGQGYRVTHVPAYREVLLQGARSLSTRFNPKTGVIKSWDRKEWKFPVIIDNMMNLELLMFASAESGDAKFRDIAVSHANRTMKEHFRPDGSSFHVVDYDPDTGAVRGRQTHQGYADSSAWARGQAWGLYGYTRMYTYTHDPAYLAHARKIADFIRKHPRLPEDGIPYWDFDAPGIPDAVRDASAGAIMCSALFELAEHLGNDGAPYRELAERQLRTLSTAAFRANVGENGGFLLMHSVSHLPGKSEVDVPLAYADYYYLEALGRFATRKAK